MTKYEKDIHKKTDEMIERLPGGCAYGGFDRNSNGIDNKIVDSDSTK